MRSSRIYGSVLKPPRLLFAATSLLYLEVFGAIVLTVLVREPVMTVVCLTLSHLFCIHLTNKEPHINNILRNFSLRAREYAGVKSDGQPHFKTESLFKNAGVIYEL